MLSQIKGIEQCTAQVRQDEKPDRYVVYLFSMKKRTAGGSSQGPFIQTIATYAGNDPVTRQMAVNHAKALNALIDQLKRETLRDTFPVPHDAPQIISQ